MDGVFMLVGLSIAMFIGSFFAGSLPLIVPFSESRLRLITVLGAGLLVGTALAVIIPEGVQSIYSAAEGPRFHDASQHRRSDNAHQQPVVQAQNRVLPESGVSLGKREEIIQQPKDSSSHHHVRKKDVGIVIQNYDPAQLLPGQLFNPKGQMRKKRDDAAHQKSAGQHAEAGGGGGVDVDFPDHHEDTNQASGGHKHAHKTDVHGTVGLALVAGFVLMLLVDQLAQHRSGRDVDLGSGSVSVVQPRYKITATIGLVVHAAADGVALGAASGSAHSEIQLIVFLAIMLHKAPASFGLVTFLLHEGLDKTRIRRHLLIFALAAPVAAILTYLFISHSGSNEKLTSMNTTGVLLLFSAGTFLYVATVHVLPEVAANGHRHSSGSGHVASGFKLNELVALVFGAVAPTFLTLGHSH